MADPRVEKCVCLCQALDGLTGISLLQKDDAFDNLGVCLRCGWQLFRQAGGKGLRLLEVTGLGECTRRQNRSLRLTVF